MANDQAAELLAFGEPSQALHEAFGKLAARLNEYPDRAAELTDRTLLALAAWTGGTGEGLVVTAECRRRLAEHKGQAARFRAFGGQLDQIADLPDDMPWTEARGVLAGRIRQP
jgi:hypothetical protein